MGPFALMDLIGLDVNLAVTRAVFDAFHGDPRYRPSLRQAEMVAAGWLGRKTGRGFHDYAKGAAPPEARTAPPGPTPARVETAGGTALAQALRAAGLAVVPADLPPGWLRVPGATIAPTDGRSATAMVAAGAPRDLVLHDLSAGHGPGHRVALAVADQAAPETAAAATGLFQALGTAVSVIDDTPGLVVARTVAMLANEACEALLHRVAAPADIDRAMLRGLNHPRGPLAWGDALGPARVLGLLDAVHATTGDPRYRASVLLRRRVAAGLPLLPDTPLGADIPLTTGPDR
jgi:3-hydroxybutyryl-CoA dehydrogenase